MTYHLNGLGQVKTGTKSGSTTTGGGAPAVDNTGRDVATAFTIGGGLLSSIIGGATGTSTTPAVTETPVVTPAPPETDWTPLYIGGGILVLGGLGWWVLSQRKVAANRRHRRSVSANPERFRIYDMGDVGGDRYTIVDAKPMSMKDGRQYYSYFGMNAHPFHPQGIGMHGDFRESEWRSLSRGSRSGTGLGKRVKMADLPPEARKAAEQFIRQSTPTKNARGRRRSKRRRGSKKVRGNSRRGPGATYRDVLTLKTGALVGVHPRPRFDITLEERTDSSTSHARYHVSVFDRRTNHSWGMDFSQRAPAEHYMDEQALALAKVGDDWNPRNRMTPNYAYEHMSHPGRYDERGRPVRNARLKASAAFKLSESIGVVRDAAPAEQKGFMPPGVASRISKMGPGFYSYGFGKRGESLRKFSRADMSGALTSTRIAASKSGESHYFIDNAAGYPVVVRIFEPSGKTVYRVEEYAQKFVGERAMAHLVKRKAAA